MHKLEEGILFLATTKEEYVVQAFLSARSIKAFRNDIPIAIFTDQPTHPLLQFSEFDIINEIQTEFHFKSKWATGKFPRVDALLKSPFKRTLQLDCDTVVESSKFDEVFSVLDQHEIAMVECKPEESFGRRAYGKRIFNTGVIAYQSCANCHHLFDEWKKLTLRHFKLIGKLNPSIPKCFMHVTDVEQLNRMFMMDQLSLAQLLSPEVNKFGLRFSILDSIWNTRGRNLIDGVIVNHLPENRKNYISRLIQYGAQLYVERDYNKCKVIYDCASTLMESNHKISKQELVSILCESITANPTSDYQLMRASLHNYFAQTEERDSILATAQ